VSNEIRTARTVGEAEALREPWSRVRWPRYDADIDFFLALLRSVGGDARPHVLAYGDAGSPKMLVARVERTRLTASFGYKQVHRPRVRALTLVHGGMSAPDDEVAAERFVAEIDGALRRREADVAVLPSLRTDSALYHAARRRARGLRAGRFHEVGTHRRLVVPDTFDAFLGSLAKKTREGVKRYAKRLSRAFEDSVETTVLREPGDIDRIFVDLEAVAARTYQRGLGVAFADTPAQRSLVSLGLERGWYRVWVLYLEGAPVAFWPGYAYNGTFFIGTPGYDPSFADNRVGMYLQMRMIEDLCADPGVQVLDYGFGDAEYKRRFGSESWEEQTVAIFGPSARALGISAIRTAVLASDRGARRLLTAAGVLDRVKRWWRGRLAGGPR
jgi:CelD/BcsL family acetyltransferase involved in cellulose biosynthesis